jgi:hypothetical protein
MSNIPWVGFNLFMEGGESHEPQVILDTLIAGVRKCVIRVHKHERTSPME